MTDHDKPFPLATLILTAALAIAPGCDSKDAEAKAGSKTETKVEAEAEPEPEPEPKKREEKKAEPEPEPEPPKPKLLACDQRDFIPEGDKKMAAQLGKEAKPKFVCMDYSKRTGTFSASCAQGTPLETPCPDDDVVATCTMSNGTVYKHYKGGNENTAKRMCKTMEGTFAKS